MLNNVSVVIEAQNMGLSFSGSWGIKWQLVWTKMVLVATFPEKGLNGSSGVFGELKWRCLSHLYVPG